MYSFTDKEICFSENLDFFKGIVFKDTYMELE